MRKVLVTGGAGYIGSHTCQRLAEKGYEPVTLDNFSYGHKWAVQWGPLYEGNIADQVLVEGICKSERIEAVLHFAGYTYVGESVQNPHKYFENNVSGSLKLFAAAQKMGVQNLIFSSTCATYGTPAVVPINEGCPQAPINPYGSSKLMVEQALQSLAEANKMKSVALRYFNAAGADPAGKIGEDHNPETHLIPLALRAVFDPDYSLIVFGNDYETPDGSCIRDYIHVWDLADAHILALEKLEQSDQKKFLAYNAGSEKGFSVFEVIKMIEQVTGRKVKMKQGDRRPGDPAKLVADSGKIRSELSWTPTHSSLENMIATATRWYEARFLKGQYGNL